MLVNQIVGSITSGPRAVFAVFNTSREEIRLHFQAISEFPSPISTYCSLYFKG